MATRSEMATGSEMASRLEMATSSEMATRLEMATGSEMATEPVLRSRSRDFVVGDGASVKVRLRLRLLALAPGFGSILVKTEKILHEILFVHSYIE